jgi:DNA polymerase-3 subunit epsilon
MVSLSAQERFEEAAAHRDRAGSFVRAVDRMQRLAGLASCRQVVAARPGFGGGWELAVIRYGRLAGASMVPVGAAPAPYIRAVVATSETVTPRPGPLGAATAEEIGQILSWLAEPGARLIALDGEWSSPVDGAGRLRHWLDAAEEGRAAARPFEDRRGLRPVHRPARAAI